MSEIAEPVTSTVDGWTITEHSYHGIPFAGAVGPARRYGGDQYEIEYDGLNIELTVDAPYEGYLYPQVPVSVILALVEIHNRRSST